jgi:hypothetical protein
VTTVTVTSPAELPDAIAAAHDTYHRQMSGLDETTVTAAHRQDIIRRAREQG